MPLMLSANPSIYAALGDAIYNTMPRVEQLADVKAMKYHRTNIVEYLQRCREAKEQGYTLQKQGTEEQMQAYLERLRYLNAEYEFYVRATQSALKRTIDEDDYAAFSELIKTGLIDIDKNSDRILKFYESNRGESRLVEIEDYKAYQQELYELEQRQALKKEELYKSYKQRRIEQVRARQEAKKQAQRKAIDEEAEQKKLELHRTQKTELDQIAE